jgi:hypothetical protein
VHGGQPARPRAECNLLTSRKGGEGAAESPRLHLVPGSVGHFGLLVGTSKFAGSSRGTMLTCGRIFRSPPGGPKRPSEQHSAYLAILDPHTTRIFEAISSQLSGPIKKLKVETKYQGCIMKSPMDRLTHLLGPWNRPFAQEIASAPPSCYLLPHVCQQLKTYRNMPHMLPLTNCFRPCP